MDTQVMSALLWAMFYANLVAIERHPGKFKEGGHRLDLKQCADYADIMMDKMVERFPELVREVQ